LLIIAWICTGFAWICTGFARISWIRRIRLDNFGFARIAWIRLSLYYIYLELLGFTKIEYRLIQRFLDQAIAASVS
jgi:hypothetical protein